MKWLGIVAGVVLAGIVGAAVLLPRLIDWQSYRPEIAAIAEEAIGFPVVIDGNIQAELFPTPQLTAGGIRVLDRAGADDLATVRWAEARFKFSDLLRGTVTLTSLALVEPVVSLSGDLLGHLRAAPVKGDDGRSEGASLGGPQRREAQQIEIRNGTFTMARSDPDAAAFLIERVSGTVENAAVGSRMTVSLSGRVQGRDLDLEMRVAPPQQAASAPIAFTLTDKANASLLRVVGEWSMKDGKVGLAGGFSVNGGDMASIAALTGMSLPPKIAASGGDFRVDGNFALDGAASTLQVTDLSANTDALSITGEASAQWSGRPKLDFALRAGRLDLDGFVSPGGDAEGTGAAPTGADGPANASPDPSATPSASPFASPSASPGAPDLMAWIGTLPADVSLDLSVAGARFRDTIVRRITVRGTVDRGTVTLEELSAQLPGGTDLSIAGFGDMTGPEPLLEGNATLRADDLRRLLNWAGLPIPNVSADRLRRFSMVSGISLRPRRLDIIDAAVELDGVTASAAAAVALRRRPGLGLRVSIDHINLDAYRSVYAPPDSEGAAPGADNPPGQTGDAAEAVDGAGTVEGPSLWSRFDASLDLRIGRAVALEVPFNDVVGNLVLKDGVVTINEITFRDAAGVSGQFGGQLSVVGDADSTFLAFEGQSADMGQVVALLEGPDFVAGILRSIGPTALNISYRPASDDAPLVFQANGDDGALSFGAALSRGEAGEPALDILSGDMKAYGLELSGLAGRLTFPAEAYQLEKLSGTLNGGTLNLSGSLRRRADGLQQLLITGALDGLEVDRHLADLDGPIGLKGSISIRGQGESTGSDWRAMAALNSGWFDMEGALAIDVGPSRSSIVTVRQVSDVREALRERFSEPASIEGALVLENGALIARDLALRGNTGGVLELSGRLGLTDLNLSAELVLRKAENAPQFARLLAEGPAKAPNLRLEGAVPSKN
ncbi:AsmA family protein [Hwanghaeella grinnelliae]|uniref:AsmA family protein n=1 Tax=Hwanghaeella grinnelliae TaxID=2500179 RepID=A0A3S2WB30_9PROT|nr:AsmA family protein [Hwanghaeella grinnelliae]RVU38329.1 AsmA family protein [Hwanghaeella grinnelliae]